MTNNLHQLTLANYLSGIRSKRFSTGEVQQAVTYEIAQKNPQLNAYVTVFDQQTTTDTRTPLADAPIALKDNILTKGLRTTASAKVLDEFKPPYSATIYEKLQKAGASFTGKTNLDAWAHGSSTETSDYGRTLNPRNPNYLPGGSSGGSAAAVAADLCIAAVGTETAGSIRQPAAWCGTVGLKPTYGRVSRYGIVAMASSTDSPGPITKTVEDSAILLQQLAGHDPHDGTTTPDPVPDYTSFLGKSIRGMKVGLLYQDVEGMNEANQHVELAAKELEKLGATVTRAQALDPHYAISVYTIAQRAEVSSNLARYDGIRFGKDRSFFGAEAKRRIMLGTYTLAKGYADKYYLTAQKVRTLFLQDYETLFSQYDVLIHPTSPGFAKKIGATENAAMFGELEDILAEPSSVTGLPGISIPCYRDEKTNLFIGLNIIAPRLREDLLISAADAYEKATGWNTWREV